MVSDHPVGLMAFGNEVSATERAALRRRALLIMKTVLLLTLIVTVDIAVILINASGMPLDLDMQSTAVQVSLGVAAFLVVAWPLFIIKLFTGPTVRQQPDAEATPWQRKLKREVAAQAAAAHPEAEEGQGRAPSRSAPPMHASVAAVHPAEVHEARRWLAEQPPIAGAV